MSNPIFISVASDGGIYASLTKGYAPTGKTIVATAEINSTLASQQIYTIGGTAGAYTATAAAAKYGGEIV
jgi:hypothetical protein